MTIKQHLSHIGVCALFDRVREWIRRAHDRNELRRYIKEGTIERQDFGIALGDAQMEASKPFWQR
jgi:uncharacterized protein YjiS (DUF1127 family)